MRAEPSYRIEDPPDHGLRWEEYERIVLAEWRNLLEADPGPTEPEVQAFLETHPCMVPGAFSVGGSESGHYPRFCGLISQAPLPSYPHRIPDFMWLSTNSEIEQPVLIEIEAPTKPWFTAGGTQSAQLTEAINQIAEWKAWLDVPHNVQAFKAFYGLDRDAWRRRRFQPTYLLVYGRRAEASADPARTAIRGHLTPHDVTAMTFDRLAPDPKAAQLICMKMEPSGQPKAISVPPTLKWQPLLAQERERIRNLDAAITRNPYLTGKRKQFLIRRLAYWNAWVRSGETGAIVKIADEE